MKIKKRSLFQIITIFKIESLARLVTFLFIFALLSCIKLIASGSQDADNQIQNGDFQQGLDGWKWSPGDSACSGKVREQVGANSENVFEIASTVSNHSAGLLEQRITGLKPDTSYDLSIWAKGTEVESSELDADEKKRTFPSGTFDWQKIELGISTASANGMASIRVAVKVNGRVKKLWITHVELLPATKSGAQISELLAKNRERYEKIRTKATSANDAYISMGQLIIERYLNRVETGGPGGIQGLMPTPGVDEEAARWSLLQINEVSVVLDKVEKRLRDLNSGVLQPYHLPILQNGKIAYDSDGFWFVPKNGPRQSVILGGFGHFNQVITDAGFLAKLGTTLTQQERGPSSLHDDGTLSPAATSIGDTIDKEELNGIYTDLLLSPHYFPQDLVKAHPDLSSPVTGPVIDHPLYRQVITHWLDLIVPFANAHTGLFGFCLTNEPGYFGSGRDPYSYNKWINYLAGKHPNIEELNDCYFTHYRSFNEVPVPAIDYPTDSRLLPAYYDWIRFNQQNVADWHRWMNAVVKQEAPDQPTHAKMAMDIFDVRRPAERTNGGLLSIGIDPELITSITDLAGCDSLSFIMPQGPYAYVWQRTNAWYDLLHSFTNRPVIDTELHFIVDGHPAESISPEHTRTVLWEGALHNRTAFVNWVFEEPYGFSYTGSIYLRPASLYGASEAMLDLNRLADKVRLINKAPAHVALLYSMTSLFWQPDYPKTVINLYTALTCAGYKITFVSERQLVNSSVPSNITSIFLPHATHVPNDVAKELQSLVKTKMKIIPVGKNNLGFTEYNQKRLSVELPQELILKGIADADVATIHQVMKGTPDQPPYLTNVATGHIASGVEYRMVPDGGKDLISMTNMLNSTIHLHLKQPEAAVDLISGRLVNLEDFMLTPLQSIMFEVNSAP